jgi:hypothetical protein
MDATPEKSLHAFALEYHARDAPRLRRRSALASARYAAAPEKSLHAFATGVPSLRLASPPLPLPETLLASVGRSAMASARYRRRNRCTFAVGVPWSRLVSPRQSPKSQVTHAPPHAGCDDGLVLIEAWLEGMKQRKNFDSPKLVLVGLWRYRV